VQGAQGRVQGAGLMVLCPLLVQGFVFSVQGSGFRVSLFRVQGLGCMVWSLEFRVHGSGFRGLGSKVQPVRSLDGSCDPITSVLPRGAGCRVQGVSVWDSGFAVRRLGLRAGGVARPPRGGVSLRGADACNAAGLLLDCFSCLLACLRASVFELVSRSRCHLSWSGVFFSWSVG